MEYFLTTKINKMFYTVFSRSDSRFYFRKFLLGKEGIFN